MTKRLIALLVAVLMVFGLVPAAALARTEPICVRTELDDALNIEGGALEFTSEGDYPWTVITEDDRVYAQSSNAGVASSTSVLTMTTTVESNMAIHFDFKAWGEGTSTAWDKCIFTIDETEIFKYGALDNDWTEFVVNVAAGEHTFVWNYSKDGTMNPTGDYFAVDNVRFEEREPLPINEALDSAVNAKGGNIHFYTDGDYPWDTGADEESSRFYGVSGNAGVNSSVSEMIAIVELENDGVVTFDYMAWGEGSGGEVGLRTIWDHCRFYVDGTAVLDVGALDSDWTSFSYELTAGEHELKWSYQKDGSQHPDGDFFAVDNVEITENEPADDLIHTIAIEGFTAPVYGEHPDVEVNVPEGAHYYIQTSNWNWLYEGFGNTVFPEDTFDNGEYDYYQFFDVIAEEGYFFAEDVTVTINGDASLVADHGFDGGQNYQWVNSIYFNVDAPEPNYIDAVEIIDFAVPAWGEHPDFDLSVPDDAHYTVDYVDWSYFGGGFGVMTADDVFDNPAATYTMYVQLIPEEGWVLADDAVFTINGDSALVDPYGCGYQGGSYPYIYVNSIGFTVEESPAEPIAITEINVVGFVTPEAGVTGAEFMALSVPADANYYISIIQAYNNTTGDPLSDEDVLEEGNSYIVGAQVVANEGYYFADDAVLLANGGTELVNTDLSYVCDSETAWVVMNEYTIPATPSTIFIDTIYVNGVETEPIAGENADDHLATIAIPDGEPYAIEYTRWFDEDNIGGFHSEFVAGGHYSVNISVGLPEGYAFAEDVTIYVNGETSLISEYVYNYTTSVAFYTIPFECVDEPEDPYAIHEVYVDGFGTPVAYVAGIDHVLLTTPDDAPYFIIYGGWRDETDQQQMWSDEHVFIPGHYYSEGCQIWADEGYYFAEDCVFYANGGTELIDTTCTYVDEIDNWICYINILPVECLGTPMLLGDVDLDGEVTTADALLAMRCAMGLIELTEEQLAQMDVNGDGVYDLIDATLILRYAMGLIEEFPLPVVG